MATISCQRFIRCFLIAARLPLRGLLGDNTNLEDTYVHTNKKVYHVDLTSMETFKSFFCKVIAQSLKLTTLTTGNDVVTDSANIERG